MASPPPAEVTVTAVSPSSGPGGTSVTVSGTNFPAPVDSVRFGAGRLAGVVRLSSTALKGTVPAGGAAGTVDVVVYSGGVASRTCLSCFTYPSPGFWASLSAGTMHACGVSSAGVAYCWGSGDLGALGDGSSRSDRPMPGPVLGGHVFTSLSAGQDFTCGVTAAGAAYCWGWNGWGQLGNDTADQLAHPSPEPVSGGHSFLGVSTSYSFACGVSTAGIPYCWGTSGYGALGNGVAGSQFAPGGVLAPELPYASISAGVNHGCGLTRGGTAYCWGAGMELGTGSGVTSLTPVAVAGGLTFTMLAAGEWHTCGLTPQGAAYCWGGNAWGELGIGDADNVPHLTPQPVLGGLVFASLAAQAHHTCGLTPQGQAYCWGSNALGEGGDGTTTQHGIPTPVAGGLTFASLAVGGLFACGVTIQGAAYCWGDNVVGQLGDGTTTQRLTPVPVAAP